MSHKTFKTGDLVRDKLNVKDMSYGLGVILRPVPPDHPHRVSTRQYEVYFTKFEKTITFHGDYLEKV